MVEPDVLRPSMSAIGWGENENPTGDRVHGLFTHSKPRFSHALSDKWVLPVVIIRLVIPSKRTFEERDNWDPADGFENPLECARLD